MSIGATAIAVGEITHNALVTQIGFSILGAATGNIEAASAVGFGAGFTESGGNLKAGLYAAATAAAFYEVGSAFQVGDAGTESGAAAQKFGQHAVLRYETHVVADGLVGGVSSEVMGGGFKSGFIGAGFGEAAGGLISKAGINSIAGHVTASALIGGTASELSGGKFANGAVTAAFAAGFAGARAAARSGISAGQFVKEAALSIYQLPTTALGLGVGVLDVSASLAVGRIPSFAFQDGALRISNLFSVGGGSGGLTLGQVELFNGGGPGVEFTRRYPSPYAGLSGFTLGQHENAHLPQNRAYGLLFVPAYILGGVLHGFHGNPFEQRADYSAKYGTSSLTLP